VCLYWRILADEIDSPEESVREDVESARAGPYFKGTQIFGFVQDTETGVLREIVGLEET
jgi:carbonic anhydrase